MSSRPLRLRAGAGRRGPAAPPVHHHRRPARPARGPARHLEGHRLQHHLATALPVGATGPLPRAQPDLRDPGLRGDPGRDPEPRARPEGHRDVRRPLPAADLRQHACRPASTSSPASGPPCPKTTAPKEPPTVVRMASIPHGTGILAQGEAFTIAGPPIIKDTDIIPFFGHDPSTKGSFADAEQSFPELNLAKKTKFRQPSERRDPAGHHPGHGQEPQPGADQGHRGPGHRADDRAPGGRHATA